MNDRRISRTVTEIAASVGAELPRRPRGALSRFFQRLRGAMRSKPERPSTLAVFDTTTEKPRDLDDPFGDPDAQRQIGTAPADKARAGKRGR